MEGRFRLVVDGVEQALSYDETVAAAKAIVAVMEGFDKRAGEERIKLGVMLGRMKQALPHGAWGLWCVRAGIDRKLGPKAMRLAAEFGKADGSVDWFKVKAGIDAFNADYPAGAMNVTWPAWVIAGPQPQPENFGPHGGHLETPAARPQPQPENFGPHGGHLETPAARPQPQPENFGPHGGHLETPAVSVRQLEHAAGIRKPTTHVVLDFDSFVTGDGTGTPLPELTEEEELEAEAAWRAENSEDDLDDDGEATVVLVGDRVSENTALLPVSACAPDPDSDISGVTTTGRTLTASGGEGGAQHNNQERPPAAGEDNAVGGQPIAKLTPELGASGEQLDFDDLFASAKLNAVVTWDRFGAHTRDRRQAQEFVRLTIEYTRKVEALLSMGVV